MLVFAVSGGILADSKQSLWPEVFPQQNHFQRLSYILRTLEAFLSPHLQVSTMFSMNTHININQVLPQLLFQSEQTWLNVRNVCLELSNDFLWANSIKSRFFHLCHQPRRRKWLAWNPKTRCPLPQLRSLEQAWRPALLTSSPFHWIPPKLDYRLEAVGGSTHLNFVPIMCVNLLLTIRACHPIDPDSRRGSESWRGQCSEVSWGGWHHHYYGAHRGA